ncbi:hypothetical protein YC2023_045184 [Brassica napus]
MTTASSCCEGLARNQTAPPPPPPPRPNQQLKAKPLTSSVAAWGGASQSMGQRIKRFDFVSRDPPQVGFESRVMGDYPARPPIKQKRSGSFYGGVTIDSIYYYGKFVYQDVNLRSYFGSIRPPTRLTFGFRLGRCILLHFPKRTFIHFFLPRRPRRLKRREKTRLGKEKGRWWTTFGKAGPIGCLRDDTEEERNEVRGRGARKRVESIRLDDRKKQNKIRGWPKKKQRYGYHDRSPSIKKNLSKSLRISGAFKHPKYAGVVNDIAFLIENDDSFRKTKLFKFFFPKKSRSDGPTSYLRTLPAVRPSLNFLVMQYFFNTKNQMNFDPVVVLNHFVAPGAAEPSTMGRANAQGRSLQKRIRSRIAFFVESSTSEKKCLAEAKNRLTHFIRLANDLRFAGTTKTTISLFPFFGATFFFLRDGVGVYNNLDAREQLLNQLRVKCWNLLGKDKVMELIEKFKNLGGIEELIKVIDMMIEIILRKRGIPYRKSIMLLRKYPLVTESQVSKCGFHIVKKKGDVLYPKRTKYSKYRKGRCSRGCKPDGTKLGFGRYGTKSCKAGRLSYRAIEAARRAIIGHFHRAMSG